MIRSAGEFVMWCVWKLCITTVESCVVPEAWRDTVTVYTRITEFAKDEWKNLCVAICEQSS